MKKHIIILLTLAISISIHSQSNYTQEEDKITQYEMVMTEYENDKDAEAVVLYDLGEYYFQGDDRRGFILNMKKRIKIKILKQAGIDNANFEIPYYIEGQDWEEIQDIRATTYNLDDGKLIKTELTNKNIFEEKINENVRVKKIALADVREGSVIEFSYKILTPYYFHMREWQFQRKIPVVYSRLKYRAIPYYEYSYLLKGAQKMDEFKSRARNTDIRFGNLLYREMEYDFGMKDMPAFKDEEYITSEKDYMVHLNFQLSKYHSPRGGAREIITTWPAMCDDFLKDDRFGKYINKSEKEAKKIFPTLDLDEKSAMKQLEVITQYVKYNYNWNRFYGKYASEDLSDFLKQKTGNVANLNLYLIGLLKAAKMDVSPVVLSTRENGIISKQHPFQQFFNYVIARVVIDGKVLYIDATEPLLYLSDLPQRCINVEGLVVKPKTEEWAYITQKNVSATQKHLQLKIIPEDNRIDINARFSNSGFSAYNYRTVYLGKNENLSKYLKERHNIDVKEEVQITDSDRPNRPFLFSFDFSTPIEGTPDKLFIHPFSNLSISDNPFKQTSRTLPVDLIFIRSDIYKSTIEIPEGYKIEFLPEYYSVDDKLIKIDYMIQSNDKVIEVSAGYSLKQNIYEAGDYIDLKMSFAEMIKRFSEMIVLVKE